MISPDSPLGQAVTEMIIAERQLATDPDLDLPGAAAMRALGDDDDWQATAEGTIGQAYQLLDEVLDVDPSDSDQMQIKFAMRRAFYRGASVAAVAAEVARRRNEPLHPPTAGD